MKDYFKLLNLPQKLLIDYNELKKQYFTLTKKTPAKRDDIEEAYQNLKERLSRLEHLLEIQGRKVVPWKNADKVPAAQNTLVAEVNTLVADFDGGQKAKKDRLKQLHGEILREFSAISIGLSHLEKEWDEKGGEEVLDKLKNQCELFCYVRSVEQNMRRCLA